MEPALELGVVEIYPPSFRDSKCSFYVDLADLLDLPFTPEAVELFRKEWKAQSLKGRLCFDSEADGVAIAGGKSAIVSAAILVNELAERVGKASRLSASSIARTRKLLARHERPKPKPWKVGDVFAFSLADQIEAYGQVVGVDTCGSPTCTLLDFGPGSDLSDLSSRNVVAMLHVQSDGLDSGEWRVVSWASPTHDPDLGPCGPREGVGSLSWDGLEILANAWFCLEPWNAFYLETYLDQYLLESRSRPTDAIMLGKAKLKQLGIQRPDWQA